MTTLTRWKLACGLFAALAGIATVRAHHGERNTPAQMAEAPSRAQIPASLRRPIHVGTRVDRRVAAGPGRPHPGRALGQGRPAARREARRGRRRRRDRHAVGRCSTTRAAASRGAARRVRQHRHRARGRRADRAHARTSGPASATRRSARSARRRAARAEKLLARAREQERRSRRRPIAIERARHARHRQRGRGAHRRLAVSGDYQIATDRGLRARVGAHAGRRMPALRKLVDRSDSRIAAAAIDCDRRRSTTRCSPSSRRSCSSGDPQLVNAAIDALAHAGEAALPVAQGSRAARQREHAVGRGQRDRRGRRPQGDRDARRDPQDGRPPVARRAPRRRSRTSAAPRRASC